MPSQLAGKLTDYWLQIVFDRVFLHCTFQAVSTANHSDSIVVKESYG